MKRLWRRMCWDIRITDKEIVIMKTLFGFMAGWSYWSFVFRLLDGVPFLYHSCNREHLQDDYRKETLKSGKCECGEKVPPEIMFISKMKETA